MKRIIITITCLIYINLWGYSQDTVSYLRETKLVLDHFSSLFTNQEKAINLASYIKEKNTLYFNIKTVDRLSLALIPEPLYYNKYKNLIIVYQNYHYNLNHSKSFLVKYFNDIENTVINDIVIDFFEPLTYHRKDINEEIVVDEKILYYCYKVKDGVIISFEKTYTPYKDPSISFKSLK